MTGICMMATEASWRNHFSLARRLEAIKTLIFVKIRWQTSSQGEILCEMDGE
jgi:hypothetical protein